MAADGNRTDGTGRSGKNGEHGAVIAPRIASRHHTVDDQVRLACRMLARQLEEFLLELDKCEQTETDQLGLLAYDLWCAGGGRPDKPQPPSGGRRLSLVAS